MKTTMLAIALFLVIFFEFVHVLQLGELVKRSAAQSGANATSADLAMLREYLDTVRQYSDISRDPSRSGAAAVLYSHQLFKGHPDEAEAYYEKVLAHVHDESVERAIRFEMVELYTHGPHPDRAKAMEQLRILMTSSSPAASSREFTSSTSARTQTAPTTVPSSVTP